MKEILTFSEALERDTSEALKWVVKTYENGLLVPIEEGSQVYDIYVKGLFVGTIKLREGKINVDNIPL